MDQSFDPGSIMRETTHSIARESTLDRSKLTEGDQQAKDPEKSEIFELVSIPFCTQNINMVQKFIH